MVKVTAKELAKATKETTEKIGKTVTLVQKEVDKLMVTASAMSRQADGLACSVEDLLSEIEDRLENINGRMNDIISSIVEEKPVVKSQRVKVGARDDGEKLIEAIKKAKVQKTPKKTTKRSF